MKIKLLAKIGVILGSILIAIYALFLFLPFILNFFIDKYTPQIVGEINKASGLNAGIEKLQVATTPKLTAGLKVNKFELYTPLNEPIIIADNFQVKMSLIPLLVKNIRVDVLKLDSADITLKFNKKGELDLLKYLPEQTPTETPNDDVAAQTELPFGFKLSNHLPNIHVGNYKVNFTNGVDNYVLSGDKTDITDFVFNKSIKIKGNGKFVLKGREQFAYNVKLFNKIMPEIDLNEFIFNSAPVEDNSSQEVQPVDVISVLRGLYDYKVTAKADIDFKTSKENLEGMAVLSNLSMIELPSSNVSMNFKGNSIFLDSNIYTAKEEKSTLNGNITTGKKPYLDINLKSNVDISNILDIVKKVALIFDIRDLQTLTANGNLNADFNVKTDTKTVKSNGFLKIPSAKVFYGLYNVGIDNINADINLADNNVNVKNIGFSILGQPLKLFGTITSDAVSDLHLTADNLSLKGLLIALGQASILKENPIYSGTISFDGIIKGKLDKINPILNLSIANIDLKNIPSDVRIKAPSTVVNIMSDGKTFGGNAKCTSIALINPAVKISIPQVSANIKEDLIEILQTPITIENIKTTVSGKIVNYLTEKISLDFLTTGDIKSNLNGDINLEKQTLNLVYATTEPSSIIIPMFDKSKMSFTGKINVTGNMMNPILSGVIDIPTLVIPEIPVEMKNLIVKLNGTILHGTAYLSEFASGGIKAQNCSTDIELNGNNFYLKNLKGNAFDGKINGNIIYNLVNAKTQIDFNGEGMNAEKAVEGAAGIKNALTGTLGFNTKLSLTVLDYNDMIKSMRGNLDFDIKNGSFGSIGKLEGLLGAQNVVNNVLLKNTIATITNAASLTTTAEFDKLDGKLSFIDGWANLTPVRSAGKSLCYYITGKFNLLNGSTNVAILGRLDAPIVAKLGVIGQLSADKVLGATTANMLKLFTTNPNGENVKAIPALTSGSDNYKDFKVTFNGGVDSKSSIKSFKWLSNPDLTEVDAKSTIEVIKDIKSSVKTDVKSTVENVNSVINSQKQSINDTKESIKATTEDFKNLFNSIKKQQSVKSVTPQIENTPIENTAGDVQESLTE